MPFAIIVTTLVVVILVWAIVYKIVSRNSFKIKFKALRSLILNEMSGSHKKEAKSLMDKCEDYMESLLRAQQKLDLLDGMNEDIKDITGQAAAFDRSTIRSNIETDMNRFFDGLVRISSVSGFDEDRSLNQLSEFTETLEDRKKVMLQLENSSYDYEEEFMLKLEKETHKMEV